jgi:hypothetical protein
VLLEGSFIVRQRLGVAAWVVCSATVWPCSVAAEDPPARVFEGSAEGNRLGEDVAGAGDVDGDGIPDYIIGEPFTSQGGAAHVFSGRTGLLIYTFTAESPDDQFGSAVAGAGDMDGDGHADIIVGAYLTDSGGTSSGRAYVFSGRTGGLLHRFQA